MAARDSDDDIRNYLPDLKTILRTADPAYGEKILREAMDNPELDEALAARSREIGACRDPLASPGKAPEAVANDVTAPSSWGKVSAEHPIEEAALPSANVPEAQAPAVAPPVTSAIPTPSAKDARPRRRRTLPVWLFVVAGAVALVSPIAVWVIVARLPPRTAPEAPGMAAALGQPAPVTLDGGAAPSVERSTPTSGSAIPTVVTSAPAQEPINPVPKGTGSRPTMKPKGRTDDAPGGAGAPSPPKTGAPIPTAAPVAPDIMQ